MARPFPPEPEESGSLEPPRRRPPTAVGTATPPPPRRPYKAGNYRSFRSTTRIAAYAVLAGSLASVSVAAFTTMTGWGLVLGGAALASSIALSVRVRGDIRAHRDRKVRAARARAA